MFELIVARQSGSPHFQAREAAVVFFFTKDIFTSCSENTFVVDNREQYKRHQNHLENFSRN